MRMMCYSPGRAVVRSRAQAIATANPDPAPGMDRMQMCDNLFHLQPGVLIHFAE